MGIARGGVASGWYGPGVAAASEDECLDLVASLPPKQDDDDGDDDEISLVLRRWSEGRRKWWRDELRAGAMIRMRNFGQ